MPPLAPQNRVFAPASPTRQNGAALSKKCEKRAGLQSALYLIIPKLFFYTPNLQKRIISADGKSASAPTAKQPVDLKQQFLSAPRTLPTTQSPRRNNLIRPREPAAWRAILFSPAPPKTAEQTAFYAPEPNVFCPAKTRLRHVPRGNYLCSDGSAQPRILRQSRRFYANQIRGAATPRSLLLRRRPLPNRRFRRGAPCA